MPQRKNCKPITEAEARAHYLEAFGKLPEGTDRNYYINTKPLQTGGVLVIKGYKQNSWVDVPEDKVLYMNGKVYRDNKQVAIY